MKNFFEVKGERGLECVVGVRSGEWVRVLLSRSIVIVMCVRGFSDVGCFIFFFYIGLGGSCLIFFFLR